MTRVHLRGDFSVHYNFCRKHSTRVETGEPNMKKRKGPEGPLSSRAHIKARTERLRMPAPNPAVPFSLDP